MMNEDKDIETKITEGINKIDNVDMSIPDIMYFNELVKSKKASLEKKHNMQFVAFIGFSIVFAAFLLSLISRNSLVFIVLQVITFVCPLIWFLSIYLYRLGREARLRR